MNKQLLVVIPLLALSALGLVTIVLAESSPPAVVSAPAPTPPPYGLVEGY